MMSEAPPFWWQKPDWRVWALYPASAIYGAVASRRLQRAGRERVDLPVLCVGNPTVGGAGKTPVAIAFAEKLIGLRKKPGFLSRGHGGSFSEAHIVDAARDSARHTGDEPLLLARHAPTAVTANRLVGARLLAENGCDFLIMDDGFQSAHIHYDYALLVVDAQRGIGNGHVIPGGPMRAPLVQQLRKANAILKMGEGNGADHVIRMAARAALPIIQASVHPRIGAELAGRRFLAFAGIGDPQKFFSTVQSAGGELIEMRSFPDHHLYADEEIVDLLSSADAKGTELITTAKDAVRLIHGTALAAELVARMNVVEIDVVFEDELISQRIINDTLENFASRRV